MQLRYGINPHQQATAEALDGGGAWPIRILSGAPSSINILDALNVWQLVRDANVALGRPVAASFKHVSPAGAALDGPLDEVAAATLGVTGPLSPIASAYARARDCDPKSSFGDVLAVSDPVDTSLAELLTTLVSDAIIAPDFEPGTLEILERKKGGQFLVVKADPEFTPPEWEERDVFGVRLRQESDRAPIERGLLGADLDALPAGIIESLLLGMVVCRYTQSNSVAYLKDEMTLGIGAGQQSRVDCTKLAGSKVDTWWLRRHPIVRSLAFSSDLTRQERLNWQIRFLEGDLTPDEKFRLSEVLLEEAPAFTEEDRRRFLDELENVSFVSDGFLPFRDNIDHAARRNVRFIAEPGGSTRASEIESACDEHGIRLVRTGLRLFRH